MGGGGGLRAPRGGYCKHGITFVVPLCDRLGRPTGGVVAPAVRAPRLPAGDTRHAQTPLQGRRWPCSGAIVGDVPSAGGCPSAMGSRRPSRTRPPAASSGCSRRPRCDGQETWPIDEWPGRSLAVGHATGAAPARGAPRPRPHGEGAGRNGQAPVGAVAPACVGRSPRPPPGCRPDPDVAAPGRRPRRGAPRGGGREPTILRTVPSGDGGVHDGAADSPWWGQNLPEIRSCSWA